jgi:hypothetical protein
MARFAVYWALAVDSHMNSKEFEHWGKARKKGMLRYVLFNGAVLWGMSMFVGTTVLIRILVSGPTIPWQRAAVIYLAVGSFIGLVIWLGQESRYCKALKRRDV